MIRIWFFSCMLCLTLGCSATPKKPPPPTPPQDILKELTDFEGKPFVSTTSKSQLRILEFWASWCVPCRESLPAMDSLYRQYQHQGLGVVAISVDEDPNEAMTLVAQIRPQFEVAWDPYGDVQYIFGVNTLPTTVILDSQGEVLTRLVGYTAENHQLIQHQVRLLLEP